MKNFVQKFATRRQIKNLKNKGTNAIEYGLLVVLIALAVFAAIQGLGGTDNTLTSATFQ